VQVSTSRAKAIYAAGIDVECAPLLADYASSSTQASIGRQEQTTWVSP